VLVVAGLSEVIDVAALDNCELFDPNSSSWTGAGSLNEARYDHTAVLLYTGQVMVVGGHREELVGGTTIDRVLQSAEFFDPEAGWTLGPPMSMPRLGHTQTLLRRDLHTPLEFKVLVAAGYNSLTDTLDNSAELFTSGEVND
jgi:hypothetical protein